MKILPRKTNARMAVLGSVVGAVLLIVALVAGIRTGGERRSRPPRLAGAPFATTQPTGGTVYFITDEEWTRYQRKRVIRSTVYELHAVDGRMGRPVVGPVRIGKFDHTPTPAQILGFSGEVLWVWNDDAVEGFSVRTLERVWPAKKLLELNPAVAEILPEDPRHYKVLAPLDGLIIRMSDGHFYRADSATGKIERIDDSKLAALSSWKKAEEGFTYSYPQGRATWITSPGSYLWNSVVHDETWYALLTPEEANNLDGNAFSGKAVSGDAARYLYSAPFTVNRFNDRVLDVRKLRRMGDERYVQGGFVRRPNADADTVALFREGPHALVVHRSAPGDTGFRLVRVHIPDGKPSWNRLIPLTELQYVGDAGPAIVLAGIASASSDAEPPPCRIVFVDVATGEYQTIDLTARTTP